VENWNALRLSLNAHYELQRERTQLFHESAELLAVAAERCRESIEVQARCRSVLAKSYALLQRMSEGD
jgi:hypothetical protein